MARKVGFGENLVDMFKRLMEGSDPKVALSSKINNNLQRNDRSPLPQDVIDMLVEPHLPENNIEAANESSNSCEDEDVLEEIYNMPILEEECSSDDEE